MKTNTFTLIAVLGLTVCQCLSYNNLDNKISKLNSPGHIYYEYDVYQTIGTLKDTNDLIKTLYVFSTDTIPVDTTWRLTENGKILE